MADLADLTGKLSLSWIVWSYFGLFWLILAGKRVGRVCVVKKKKGK